MKSKRTLLWIFKSNYFHFHVFVFVQIMFYGTIFGQPASLGIQDHQANTWVNNWGFGGRWLGDQAFLAFSKFKNNPMPPFSPVSPVSPSDWFDPTGSFNNYLGCIDNAGLSAICSQRRPENEEEQVLMGMAAHPELLDEPNRSMVLRKAYSILMDLYPTGNFPENMAAFMDMYEEKIWAKLAEIDFILQHPLVEEPELANQIHELQDSLINMMPAYNAYQMSLGNLSYQDLIVALAQTPPIIKTQFANVTTTLTALHQQSSSITTQKLALANYLNQNLQPDNDYTALEKALNSIYINHQLTDSLDYSASESATIKEMAFYCPQDKGDVVYKARVLYIQLGGAIDKAWEGCSVVANNTSIENRNSRLNKPISESNTELPKIFPVPTDDLLNVYVPKIFEGAKYRIMNHLGVVISNGNLSEQISTVDLHNLKNGLYFFQIDRKESAGIVLKFVVQK